MRAPPAGAQYDKFFRTLRAILCELVPAIHAYKLCKVEDVDGRDGATSTAMTMWKSQRQ
jgi:hypothetical protein